MSSLPVRLAVILVAAAALPAMAKDNNLAVVNGKPIPASNLESLVKMQTSRGQPDSPEMRAQLKQQLVNIELLSQEGIKLGLEKNADVKNEIELARKEILGRAMVADFAKKNPASEADIKAEYEKYKSQATGGKEYRAHHILVAKEDEAKDIIAKLKGGAKFEELAKLSKDSVGITNGGELDWAPAVKYPKPFSDALAALQKGQITETPVKTQLGFHVIRLDDVRSEKVATFDELKPKISLWLTQKKLQEYQQDLEKKAKIQ